MIDPSDLPAAEEFADPSAWRNGTNVNWEGLLGTAVLGSILAYMFAFVYGVGRIFEEIALLVGGLLTAPAELMGRLLLAFQRAFETATQSAAGSIQYAGPFAWLLSIGVAVLSLWAITVVVTRGT